MIQSGKFDSSNMDIKKLANSVLIFLINRLIEIIGILVSCFGVLLFVALISYSSSDPNFIFPDNTEIKNLLGFQGSYISDLFFQSIGLVSFLISFTFFFTFFEILSQNCFLKNGFSRTSGMFIFPFFVKKKVYPKNEQNAWVAKSLSVVHLQYENFIFASQKNVFFIKTKKKMPSI